MFLERQFVPLPLTLQWEKGGKVETLELDLFALACAFFFIA
jgi:hypothetical protein